jgi:tetratricopeptide (TPR) repeat protein
MSEKVVVGTFILIGVLVLCGFISLGGSSGIGGASQWWLLAAIVLAILLTVQGVRKAKEKAKEQGEVRQAQLPIQQATRDLYQRTGIPAKVMETGHTEKESSMSHQQYETLRVEAVVVGMRHGASFFHNVFGGAGVWNCRIVARVFPGAGESYICDFEDFIRVNSVPLEQLNNDAVNLRDAMAALNRLDLRLVSQGWEHDSNGPFWYSYCYMRPGTDAMHQQRRCVDALTIDPKKSTTYNNKGASLNDRGRYEEALTYFDEAIQFDPRDASAYNNKGYSLSKLGRDAEAVEVYEEAIRRNPRHGGYYINIATSYKSLDRYEDALRAFTRASALQPEAIGVYVDICNILRRLGRYEETVRVASEGIRLDPRCAGLYASRGSAFASLERYEEALRDYNEAVRLDPGETGISDERDMLLEKLGR